MSLNVQIVSRGANYQATAVVVDGTKRTTMEAFNVVAYNMPASGAVKMTVMIIT